MSEDRQSGAESSRGVDLVEHVTTVITLRRYTMLERFREKGYPLTFQPCSTMHDMARAMVAVGIPLPVAKHYLKGDKVVCRQGKFYVSAEMIYGYSGLSENNSQITLDAPIPPSAVYGLIPPESGWCLVTKVRSEQGKDLRVFDWQGEFYCLADKDDLVAILVPNMLWRRK